jgi:hypothetical protein
MNPININKNIISQENGITIYEVINVDTNEIIVYDYVSDEVNE